MNILKLATSGIFGTLTVNGFIEREMNNYDIDTYKPIDTVSVVVPCYNEERFIKRTLTSLRGQSIITEYPEYFELIVVDNGSTDNTVSIAEKYVDKVIIENRKGKLNARNRGIKESSGNIIVATDADIYFQSFWLNTLLEPFNNIDNPLNANISGVSGSIYNPNIPGVPAFAYNIAHYIDKTIVHQNNMSGANSAFWKHKFYKIGGFNENINQLNAEAMHQEEERDFGTKLTKLGRVIFKLNAMCIHLGGERTGCRLGTTSRDFCKSQGINIERFG
jgi:glycosyltransferase involved in cell wall biosynthesis